MLAIRAVFFDAVGTLIHPEPSAAKVYGEIGRRFGSRYSAAAIATRFVAAFRKQEDFDRQRAGLPAKNGSFSAGWTSSPMCWMT